MALTAMWSTGLDGVLCGRAATQRPVSSRRRSGRGAMPARGSLCPRLGFGHPFGAAPFRRRRYAPRDVFISRAACTCGHLRVQAREAAASPSSRHVGGRVQAEIQRADSTKAASSVDPATSTREHARGASPLVATSCNAGAAPWRRSRRQSLRCRRGRSWSASTRAWAPHPGAGGPDKRAYGERRARRAISPIPRARS